MTIADQRMALFRLAESIQKQERHATRRSKRVLKREPPRIQGLSAGERVHTIDLNEMKSRALGLDSSYLFIQGPPGAGKTWAGARLIAHLLKNGKRVGVAAQSHKAIHNLLNEIEKFARENGLSFRGLKKSTDDNPDSIYEGDFIKSEPQVKRIVEAADRVQLLAGTAWLFSRHELDRTLDYLVIDEAGQVSLADALAMGTSARNLILLGDPLQLAQVSQGLHPQGSGASVLEHLLGEAPTIPEERGIFLEKSYRMHPDVCSFISEIVYAGRLHSDQSAAQRTTSSGTGIRFVPVEHDGNRAASDEEVVEIAKLIAQLGQGTFTDCRWLYAPAPRGRLHGGCSLQRPGAAAPRGTTERRACRDRRQVSGPTGADRLFLDGNFQRRRRAAQSRISFLPQSPQRRDLSRAVPRLSRFVRLASLRPAVIQSRTWNWSTPYAGLPSTHR